MAKFYVRQHPIEDGRQITFYEAVKNLNTPERPLVVFIHGALRNASAFYKWGDVLGSEADVVLLDLPCHGTSSPVEHPNVETFAQIVGDALFQRFEGRNVLLAGESIGGLVAMRIAAWADTGPVRAVVAFDPPMTTTKLWNVEQSFRAFMSRAPSHDVLFRFADEAFGIFPVGNAERIYYPLLGELRLPTMIVTGTVPLFPVRDVPPVPCLFDEVDQFILANFYPDKAVFRQVNGGHLLLATAMASCRILIEEMIGEHLVATTPGRMARRG